MSGNHSLLSNISITDRLASPRPFLLDGPTGTELARRGVSTDTPLWSAAALLAAPEMVGQIHRDYVAAGAELITANTFRTHARNVRGLANEGGARRLTQLAVKLAKSASDGIAWVAGSLAPLEDCYRPDLTPPPSELEREHLAMAKLLSESGVDVILAETHPTIRESAVAARAAIKVGLPVMVSWVCGRDGRLLSGESLSDAVSEILPIGPLAVLVNCLPTETAVSAVRELRRAAGSVPVGAYANVGWADAAGHWVQGDSVDPAVYAERASDWLESGARIIGSCCGTTPEHISRLRQMLDDRALKDDGGPEQVSRRP